MNNRINIFEGLLLLSALIYTWPIAQINMHSENSAASFDDATNKWLITLNEELSSGILVSLAIVCVYSIYWFKYQE